MFQIKSSMSKKGTEKAVLNVDIIKMRKKGKREGRRHGPVWLEED